MKSTLIVCGLVAMAIVCSSSHSGEFTGLINIMDQLFRGLGACSGYCLVQNLTALDQGFRRTCLPTVDGIARPLVGLPYSGVYTRAFRPDHSGKSQMCKWAEAVGEGCVTSLLNSCSDAIRAADNRIMHDLLAYVCSINPPLLQCAMSLRLIEHYEELANCTSSLTSKFGRHFSSNRHNQFDEFLEGFEKFYKADVEPNNGALIYNEIKGMTTCLTGKMGMIGRTPSGGSCSTAKSTMDNEVDDILEYFKKTDITSCSLNSVLWSRLKTCGLNMAQSVEADPRFQTPSSPQAGRAGHPFCKAIIEGHFDTVKSHWTPFKTCVMTSLDEVCGQQWVYRTIEFLVKAVDSQVNEDELPCVTSVGVTCPALDHPTNGMVSWTVTAISGKMVTFTCDKYYDYSRTPNTRQCQQNGRWSGQIGECRALQDVLITAIIPLPWTKKIANQTCGWDSRGYLMDIYRQVHTAVGIGRSVKCLGTSPTLKGETRVTYEVLQCVIFSKYDELQSELDMLCTRKYGKSNPSQVNMELLYNRDMNISAVRPKAGPRAGGTKLFLTGSYLDKVKDVTIGDLPCTSNLMTQTVVICMTEEYDAGDAIQMTWPNWTSPMLDVMVRPKNNIIVRVSQYQYVQNPKLFKMEPSKIIHKGGVAITVFGSDLATVQTRMMVTAVTALVTNEATPSWTGRQRRRRDVFGGCRHSFRTPCTYKEETSDRMFCPSPPINQTMCGGVSMEEQHADDAPEKYSFDVVIAFELDGVQKYRNLTDTKLEKYSHLTLHADPVLYDLTTSGLPVVFVPIWPEEDTLIEIRGDRLLEGLRAQEYKVIISQQECRIDDVLNNKIICQPPMRRPHLSEDTGSKGIPVKVHFAGHIQIVGSILYQQTLWEYPPGRYTILGLCGLVGFVITVIVARCILKRKRSANAALLLTPTSQSSQKIVSSPQRAVQSPQRGVQSPQRAVQSPQKTDQSPLDELKSRPLTWRQRFLMELRSVIFRHRHRPTEDIQESVL